jgi:predicted ATP-grasp superfamily ATP-dependent carboligase
MIGQEPSEAACRLRPPVILLGGAAGNALSVARSLGRRGIPVYILSTPGSPVIHSRYARCIDVRQQESPQACWTEYLLGRQSEPLRGAVLLACSDVGIEILLKQREQLAKRYLVDICSPEAQLCFLNKLSTYEKAREAGVPAPLFWRADSEDEVRAHRAAYVFPMLLKPLFSHKFQAVGQGKYIRVTGYAELIETYRRVSDLGVEVVLLEDIPGPDDRLCSYYTYIDEDGLPLFDLTKRVIRRYPVNQGLASYHVTDRNPEVRELGLQLLQHVGHLGLANVEFKHDVRDGKLKLIECNARFTAANVLLMESGYDLGSLVYNRLVGAAQPPLTGKPYAEGLHLWYPVEDFRAFLQLRSREELTFATWALDVAHRQVLPYFCWDDPAPSMHMIAQYGRRGAKLGAEAFRRRLPRRAASLTQGG